jgi:hypothetical protein
VVAFDFGFRPAAGGRSASGLRVAAVSPLSPQPPSTTATARMEREVAFTTAMIHSGV